MYQYFVPVVRSVNVISCGVFALAPGASSSNDFVHDPAVVPTYTLNTPAASGVALIFAPELLY